MAKKDKGEVNAAVVGEKPKKKKKWWLWVIIALVVIIGLFGCNGGSDDEENAEEPQTEAVEEQTEEVTEDAAESGTADVDKKALAKELKDKYGMKGGSSVRNDVTGGWTIETIASADANDPSVWAYDYYQAFWEDGNTVKWIVNFANNTTTSINASDGNSMIFVTQRDYVEDEEHDAKALGGGTELKSWVMYIGDDGNLVVEEG